MDKRLKQRLIGAAVLVALAVIIIPELVRGPAEQEAPAVNMEIPPRPAELSENRGLTISLPDASPAPESEPATRDPFQVVEPDTTAPATASPPAASRSPERHAPPEPTGAAIASRQPASESRPAPELFSAPPPPALTGSAEPSRTAEPSRSEESTEPSQPAEPSRSEVARAVQLPKIELIGRSTGAGYEPSAPVDAPVSSGESGWVVQVGSFSSRENANLLRDRLRQQNFPVSVERVTVDGSALYRVRVGPQVSRAESEDVLERLRREVGVNGQVVSLGS